MIRRSCAFPDYIASDSGGNPELLQPGVDGEIFRAGDAAQLGAIFEKLFAGGTTAAHERALSMGRAARTSALQRFTPANHLDGLIERYQTAELVLKQGGLARVGGLA